MEMRAKEFIETGQDITPQIPPLAYSLYNSFLSSYCSSCFLPLTTQPTPTTFLQFCNNGVCLSFSSLHYSSSETHLFTLLNSHPSLYPYPDTSDLRLALRLLHLLPSHFPSLRIFGLLTNRDHQIHDHDRFSRVQIGAKAIATARAMRNGRNFELGFEFDDELLELGFELEEALLCLVITNSVEINIDGQRVGVGVYNKCFSWINHSCSPNSCFRFVPSFGVSETFDGCPSMRILPSGDDFAAQRDDGSDYTTCELGRGAVNYGPRIIVRSIKEIERGEEVTITYIDLLQPTALRQSELLLEYKFLCNCQRCRAVPQAYVDLALQEMFWVDLRKGCSKTLDKHNKELAFENLRVMLDSTIAEYMEDGNPVPCCEKVERLLSDGEFDQTNEASDIQIKLSPLHTLSLNAYTTLVSTYKIRAAMRTDEMQFQNIEMRTSAAYSLLLAGATNHLFLSEPSLVASAATFWMDAGQSLLQFGGSLSCSLFAKAELPKLSVIMDVNCPKCSLLDKFKLVTASSQSQDKLCNDMSNEFHRCVSAIIPKIWSFLSQGCKYLKHVKDPIDFSWIQAMKSLDNAPSLHDDFSLFNGCDNEDHELIHVKAYISRLGSHCYLYGGYLSSICYGHSCSSVLIRNVIHI